MKTLILALVALSPLAHADDWSHLRRSSGGVNIAVDYIVTYHESHDYKPTNTYVAAPLYVNVSGAGLTGSQSVRVVLDSFEARPYGGFLAVPITYTLDLRWQGDHYSGDLSDAVVTQYVYNYGKGRDRPLVIRSTGYGGTAITRQDLAVVVDGKWIKNGEQNFDLDLFERR